MSVWISLYRNFQVLILVIYCLIINVLLFCFLATAHLDYHIFLNLSTTFLKFFKIFYFSFKLYCRSLERSLRIPNVFPVVNNFFWFFSTFFSHTISCVTLCFKPQNLVLSFLHLVFSLCDFNKSFFCFASQHPALPHSRVRSSFSPTLQSKRQMNISSAFQRRGWDSNPRALSDKRFSRPPRYDLFDTSAY